MEIFKGDVLVVGGGGAAIRSAIATKEKYPQAKVFLATKGELGKSGVTAIACSDRMAFHATLEHTEPQGEEAWRYHAEDIYKIGGYVSDEDLAEILAKNGADAFHYLDQLGVPFAKVDGKAHQFVTDGSIYARACYTGPRTAVHIEEALVKRIRELDIQVIEHCMVSELIIKEGKIAGAFALDTRLHEDRPENLKVFHVKNIVFATGGPGKMYKYNVYPMGMGADAHAMVYHAGAELVNMEFIQIGLANTKTKLNFSGSLMRAVPKIINDKGEEFLPKYFAPGTSLEEIYNLVFEKGASWPVSYEHKTHIIDIAIYKEIMSGHKVYFDYSTNPTGFTFSKLSEKNRERYFTEQNKDFGAELRETSPLYRLKEINTPSILWLKEHGVDLEKGDLPEIAPCAQHFQGGIRIREYGNTNISGLFAAGECAGGQHGANRPGGNALLDCQVFGKITGEKAGEQSEKENFVPVNEQEITAYQAQLTSLLENKEGLPAYKVRAELQDIMHQAASIVRTEKGLTEALGKLADLQAKGIVLDGNGLPFLLETKNLFIAAEMVLRAALLRQESRGPHLFFANYEDSTPMGRKDPEWQKYIVIRKGSQGMELDIQEPYHR
ncbi:MAG: fumarate reductase/succinate dehydrogenase flavoprotein domain protein [Peptococcaceae bacterium]|nr:fumarate reductase/succinate dehydrogenase flavoprotein domain protein [Peptococcaceae bacterium]